MRISDWSSDVCSSDLFASDCTADSVDPGGAANICEVVAKMLARLRPSPKHLLSVVRRTTLFHRLQYAWNLLIMEHDSGTIKPQILIRQVDGQIQRREMMANAYAPLVACDRHRITESSVMGRASQNFVYVRAMPIRSAIQSRSETRVFK